MAEQIVRYTFTVYCDTPVLREFDDDLEGYPEMDRGEALGSIRRALKHTDFADTDFELMDTETLDC